MSSRAGPPARPQGPRPGIGILARRLQHAAEETTTSRLALPWANSCGIRLLAAGAPGRHLHRDGGSAL